MYAPVQRRRRQKVEIARAHRHRQLSSVLRGRRPRHRVHRQRPRQRVVAQHPEAHGVHEEHAARGGCASVGHLLVVVAAHGEVQPVGVQRHRRDGLAQACSEECLRVSHQVMRFGFLKGEM